MGFEAEARLTRFAARALNLRLATKASKGELRLGTFGVDGEYL